VDHSSLDRSKISLHGHGHQVVNLGNIKDKAKDQRLSGILAKIGKIKSEINASTEDLDFDLQTFPEHISSSGQGYGQGSLERKEDSPNQLQPEHQKYQNVRVEYDGRKLHT